MISIIAAVASNGVIGGSNRLLWHISEDLKRFKAITSGHPVVMGRKTFESLGRPLPNRTNVVITRNSAYSAEGVRVVASLEEAIALFSGDEEVFVIGGGEIYTQALPIADKLYLTIVEYPYKGDTMFPEWDKSQWRLTEEVRIPRGETFEYPFTYLTYERVVAE